MQHSLVNRKNPIFDRVIVTVRPREPGVHKTRSTSFLRSRLTLLPIRKHAEHQSASMLNINPSARQGITLLSN